MRTAPALALGLLVIGFIFMGCGGPREIGEIPEELLGIWKTDGDRYSKRFLEIRYREVVVGVGVIEFDRLAIERIDVDEVDGSSVYRLHYLADEGYPDHLALVLQDSPKPGLQVGNIPFLWRKSETR